MRGITRCLYAGLVLCLALLPSGGASAQTQGVAVITSPLDGAILNGLVPINGTATHPQFQRYELAFAYSPNPAGNWFALQPPVITQVVNEIIGRWDTTQISDGLYSLRLRVYYSETAFLEAFVQNVRVQNATPTPVVIAPETPTPPVAITLPPLATATATATAPGIQLPPTIEPTLNRTPLAGGEGGNPLPPDTSTTRISSGLIGQAFLSGVRLTVVCFLILAAYAAVRAALRIRPRRRRQ
jgi:hypothetical protein